MVVSLCSCQLKFCRYYGREFIWYIILTDRRINELNWKYICFIWANKFLCSYKYTFKNFERNVMQNSKLYLLDTVTFIDHFVFLFVCIKQLCLTGRSRKPLKRFRKQVLAPFATCIRKMRRILSGECFYINFLKRDTKKEHLKIYFSSQNELQQIIETYIYFASFIHSSKFRSLFTYLIYLEFPRKVYVYQAICCVYIVIWFLLTTINKKN